VQEIDDKTVASQLYLRRAADSSFRVYTLIAENNVAVTSQRVPLLRSQFPLSHIQSPLLCRF